LPKGKEKTTGVVHKFVRARLHTSTHTQDGFGKPKESLLLGDNSVGGGRGGKKRMHANASQKTIWKNKVLGDYASRTKPEEEKSRGNMGEENSKKKKALIQCLVPWGRFGPRKRKN